MSKNYVQIVTKAHLKMAAQPSGASSEGKNNRYVASIFQALDSMYLITGFKAFLWLGLFSKDFSLKRETVWNRPLLAGRWHFGGTHHSPNCTAFSTPTAAVLCQSKPWPTWSAWALVLSSNRTSRGSLVRGRYCRFFISFIDLQRDKKMH